MVIRLISVSDQLELTEVHEIFQTVLGWSGDVGYIFRIHGKDYHGFRRRTGSITLRDFHLQSHDKFLYTCDVVICGNGTSAFWTFRRENPTTMRLFAWEVEEPHPRSSVADRVVID